MHKWKRIILVLVLTFIFGLAVCADSESLQHDGYILKFKNEKCLEIAMNYLANSGILAGEEGILSKINISDYIYKAHNEKLTSFFEKLGLLEYSEPDAICYLLDYDYNADYYYKAYQSTGAHACSNAPGAWKYGVYGNDVKVAVIDSGVRSTHEDLAGRVSDGFSIITGSPATTAVNGHGTAVAGVIAAAANGKGVVGVAHRAQIIPLKVTDGDAFYASQIALMVEQAIKMDADVINMSLGVSSDVSIFKSAINKAVDAGIIVVAASGNTSSYAQGTIVYPGCYDNVVSVGNIMKSGGSFIISSGSIANYGVTVSAPGTSVYTTSSYSDTSYSPWNGTSFASPYVAGIAALAKSVDPDITQSEFMELITATADKSVLGENTRLDTYGYGIADAGAFIEALIARRQKGGFVSPIDKTVSSGINVKVCNPLETPQTYSFIAKVYSVGRPISFAYRPLTLNPGEVVEIPLATLSGAESSNISCYLLDPIKLKPLYKKIDK